MKIIKHLILHLMIQMIFYSFCFTQSSLNAGGNTIYAQGGNISVSLGQLTYGFYTDGNYSIIEGVQQPFEITIDEIETEQVSSQIKILVFPNPTSGKIILEIPVQLQFPLNYLLTDEVGNLLEVKEIDKTSTEIDISLYRSNTFILIIEKDKHPFKVFKLIKHRI